MLQVDFSTQSFWDRGQFPQSFANPWVNEDNSAPFNREFFIIMNLAVGGSSNYFPDGQGGKPWANADQHSPNTFLNSKGQWYPTWKGEDAALQVDWIKVWSLGAKSTVEQESFL